MQLLTSWPRRAAINESRLGVLAIVVVAMAACGAPSSSGGAHGKAECIQGRGCRAPLRYPIVLAHGFNASPGSDWGFSQAIVDRLSYVAGPGRVFVAQVNPYHSSAEVRGPELAEFVRQVLGETGASKAHIVAHSQGGLDARWVASEAGGHAAAAEPFVASVTTISTPHRGTRISDVALSLVDRSQGPFGVMARTLRALAATRAPTARVATLPITGDSLFEAAELVMSAQLERATQYEVEYAGQMQMRATHETMAEAHIDRFNSAYPDNPQVAYLSWAGISYVHGWLEAHEGQSACSNDNGGRLPDAWFVDLHKVRDHMDAQLYPIAIFVASESGLRGRVALEPSDGVVTVESARHGLFRGCIRADHLGEVGYQRRRPDDVDFDLVRVDPDTGFDAGRFFEEQIGNDLRLVEALADVRLVEALATSADLRQALTKQRGGHR